MTDLSVLIADLCDGLGSDPGAVFPAFPGSLPGKENRQVIEDEMISRSFRSSRLADGGFAFESDASIENTEFSDTAHAHTSSCVLEPGKPGNQEPVAGAFPVTVDPLPISPVDVRAGVARELRALAEDGREGPDALRDAIAITAAKIRNSPVLVERQVHDGRCHACGDALDDTRPVVAVMQAKGGPLWLHHGACCLEHSRRRAALVAEIMMAAGFGASTATGETA